MLALFVTALLASLALRVAPSAVTAGSRAGSLLVMVSGAVLVLLGWLGMVFGGLYAVWLLWRAFTNRGPVVTITREGIRDTRVAADFIPWRAVQDIRVFEVRKQRGLVLEIDPAVEAGLKFTLSMAPRSCRASASSVAEQAVPSCVSICVPFSIAIAKLESRTKVIVKRDAYKIARYMAVPPYKLTLDQRRKWRQ
jgi:hypothetical protein